MSRPPCRMRPLLCASSPAMMRSSVVLPQPEGPRKQTNSPLWMSRSIASSAVNVPKDYEARLVNMDFEATAASRERVLAEWTQRYNAKSEKR